MTELELIKACIRDDTRSQQILYEQYLPYVYGICRRFNIIDFEIKDLIQEIFIEVFLSLKRFDPKKGKLKYWIKSIAIHKILNQLRKKALLFTDLAGEATEIGGWDRAMENLDTVYILELIRELPKGFGTIFNLYEIDGYSHKEISKMLGIKESASRSQLSRAKKLLQEKLLTVNK